ncbi:MAG TPA: hypothetical protein VD865_17840 [Stenotrophomonas sp.]|nr:hypothetical protein [Stenotrophomonas sp.]
MALSREALQSQLDHLAAAVDELLATEGDCFSVAFAGMADAIADEAAGADRCWVESQAVAILERRGLVVPAEVEG